MKHIILAVSILLIPLSFISPINAEDITEECSMSGQGIYSKELINWDYFIHYTESYFGLTNIVMQNCLDKDIYIDFTPDEDFFHYNAEYTSSSNISISDYSSPKHYALIWNSIYYRGLIIESIDSSTFTYASDPMKEYFKDDNNIYYYGEILEWYDAESFAIIKGKPVDENSDFSFLDTSKIDAANTLATVWIIEDKSANTEEYKFNADISRKEAMKIFMKISWEEVTDECNGLFKDVSDDWGCKYIESGLKYNFISQNKLFNPSISISKAEVLKLIFKVKKIDPSVTHFSNWQLNYVMSAQKLYFISDSWDDYDSPATREWVFQTIARVITMY